MTREKAIKQFETLLLHVDTDCVMGMETTEAINMAIKALEQPEPCVDVVSREAAIDVIISFFKLTDYNESAYAVRTVLGDLPPVTPKQRTGKWIKITNTLYKCDQCGAVQLKGNYCKDCGAKMEGTNNEKVNIQRT